MKEINYSKATKCIKKTKQAMHERNHTNGGKQMHGKQSNKNPTLLLKGAYSSNPTG
jgi:hypothetical protein